jgi:hypothetical protein
LPPARIHLCNGRIVGSRQIETNDRIIFGTETIFLDHDRPKDPALGGPSVAGVIGFPGNLWVLIHGIIDGQIFSKLCFVLTENPLFQVLEPSLLIVFLIGMLLSTV